MENLKDWQKVWRQGILPNFSKEELTYLRDGLKNQDVRLQQGWTTKPSLIDCDYKDETNNIPADHCCAISYMGMSKGLSKVGELFEYFDDKILQIETTLEKSNIKLTKDSCDRYIFLDWFDEGNKIEVFEELLKEVELALEQ